MKKSIFLLFLLFTLASCKQNNRFSVSGIVKDAGGEMLYLEHTGLFDTKTLDSVKLDEKGDYKFKSDRPSYPDFYRLRLNNKIIAFSVDSCEDIFIETKNTDFATQYDIKGSDASQNIQRLRISVMNIQRKANELRSDLSAQEKNDRIAILEKDIEAHKKFAQKLILQNPRSTAAYFAIYQKVNDTYIFSPYVKVDKPYCAAVATSYNAFMPEYERTKNLYSLVMDAIRTERKAKQDEAWDEVLASHGTGYIDIALNDKNDVQRKLSELEGKLVLIDFSAYESEQNVDYTFGLRELYNKYHSRGFEIFQISLDQNKMLWQESTKSIPWICVRDENGPNTAYVSSYNISSIPTTFLMTKQGTIVARSLPFDQLKKEIEKSL